MEFSIKILPPTPLRWKKNIFFPQFFFMSLLCLLSPNLARTLKKKLISASFKMFLTRNLKSKSLTNCRDFYPDPMWHHFHKLALLKPLFVDLMNFYFYCGYKQAKNPEIWRKPVNCIFWLVEELYINPRLPSSVQNWLATQANVPVL